MALTTSSKSNHASATADATQIARTETEWKSLIRLKRLDCSSINPTPIGKTQKLRRRAPNHNSALPICAVLDCSNAPRTTGAGKRQKSGVNVMPPAIIANAAAPQAAHEVLWEALNFIALKIYRNFCKLPSYRCALGHSRCHFECEWAPSHQSSFSETLRVSVPPW